MKDIDAGTYKCIATNKLGNDTASRSLTVGKIKGAVESLPEFFWRIVMKLPEFNLFCDKSARIFLIFLSICPNFNGFSKFGGGGSCSSSVVRYITADIIAFFKNGELVGLYNRYDFRFYILSTNSMFPLFITNKATLILRNCHISCYSDFLAGTGRKHRNSGSAG